MSNPLLKQFIIESRELLESASKIIIELEEKEDKTLINELFRLVHTLKGNSGLFNFYSMTKLLHALEDLMGLIRENELSYSSQIADILLDGMDLVSFMIEEIEKHGSLSSSIEQLAEQKSKEIRENFLKSTQKKEAEMEEKHQKKEPIQSKLDFDFSIIPEEYRMKAVKEFFNGKKIILIQYSLEAECFYKGEDPFYYVRNVPDIIWARYYLREEVLDPSLIDIYKCITNFEILSTAKKEDLVEHFKYVLDQVKLAEIEVSSLIFPHGDKNGGPVYEDFIIEAKRYLNKGNIDSLKTAINALLEFTSPTLYIASSLRWILVLIEHLPIAKVYIEPLLESIITMSMPVFTVEKKEVVYETARTAKFPDDFIKVLKTQKEVLERAKLSENSMFKNNIIIAVISVIENAILSIKNSELLNDFKTIKESKDIDLIIKWIDNILLSNLYKEETVSVKPELPKDQSLAKEITSKVSEEIDQKKASPAVSTKVLKVDEEKIDRLMNLIGELVVAKNALLYLASKVENVYQIPEIVKDIKAQYSVINRLSEEMHGAIMQVRMIPVSFVFQRYPRLVRDISKKLNKKVNLIMEGEETEADKNVIEALSDPLIHLIRNSIDHGIESPEERIKKGKPETGTVILRAKHEGDHLLIEVIDDGKGIDPNEIKIKAYKKGVITEEELEKITDEQALNLIFHPGFSTKESASDLSGRGVGMDVVKSTVENLKGSVKVKSVKNQGTTVSLSLPLSMAVSHIIIIESGEKKFGIPMDFVVETVRIPRERIHTIKGKMTTVLRDKVVPLFYLNKLLDIEKPQILNESGEYAGVVVNTTGELIGIIVDKFLGTMDIILKPFAGYLANLKIFSGTAIMGDGSVLLIINPEELIYATAD
ncbi:chemotaxis protein CheA [Caldimicrobium thiodismutans]|uniref:histidine kinase n=1 Tax=Caldimicrobium thiodismutans TaxID=1653476 RepID=A0A0U5AFM8_9BACT|nr:chemotaxis protein CheA [Caldimicrobium thiodismutans]BAU22812.1 chemotaxis protein CheA [Caldimicrobium thiodismutans]